MTYYQLLIIIIIIIIIIIHGLTTLSVAYFIWRQTIGWLLDKL
jgi:uncharacterized integral membrane protein